MTLIRDRSGNAPERGVGRRGMTRAAPFSISLVFLFVFAGAARATTTPAPDYGLAAHASGQRLARANRLAEWLGPLFRHVCFRGIGGRVDYAAFLAERPTKCVQP